MRGLYTPDPWSLFLGTTSLAADGFVVCSLVTSYLRECVTSHECDELTDDELTVWRDDHVTTWLCDELTGSRF